MARKNKSLLESLQFDLGFIKILHKQNKIEGYK